MSPIARSSLKCVRVFGFRAISTVHAFLCVWGHILCILNPVPRRGHLAFMLQVCTYWRLFCFNLAELCVTLRQFYAKSAGLTPACMAGCRLYYWRQFSSHGRCMHHLQTQKTSTEIHHRTPLLNPPAVCLQALSLVSSKAALPCLLCRKPIGAAV